MEIMGLVQRGLPLLSALPKKWPIIVIDIKDCFFSIPLCAKDSVRFAFTLPSVNHEEPDKRFQWVVLPQGMANSPTMCQLYVAHALKPIREKYPDVRCIHYMDDILVSANCDSRLNAAYTELVKGLEQASLFIAPEKVQKEKVIAYLGTKIFSQKIVPQKISLRIDKLSTLNDFQKLMGDIQWIRPYLRIPNVQLRPLYDIMLGNPDLNSPRQLTDEARETLKRVEEELEHAFLAQRSLDEKISLCILATESQPTGVLWQGAPLLWIHPKSAISRTVEHYPSAVALLALSGIQQCRQYFGCEPYIIITPYNAKQVEVLIATIDDWTILKCSYSGDFDNHFPKDPLLCFVKEHPIVFPKITQKSPIAGAVTIFTDGSKNGCGAYVIQGKDPIIRQFTPGSPQIIELKIVIEVFREMKESFNLLSDSQYVVNLLKGLELVGKIKVNNPISHLLGQLKDLIKEKKFPFFVQCIRAHTGLPGSVYEGNDVADKATRAVFIFMATNIQRAKDFHE